MSEVSDLETQVQTSSVIDTGETASQPSSAERESSAGPRRRRRGGRGRGGARRAPDASGGPGSSVSAVAEPAEAPPGAEDMVAAAGLEGSRSGTARDGDSDADATGTGAPRRRRRRGGRGRGGRGGSARSAAAEGSQTSPEVDVEPADPEPRPEVAALEAVADEVEGVEDGSTAEGPAGTERVGTSARRRRRRGGRGRGRSRSGTAATAEGSAETVRDLEVDDVTDAGRDAEAPAVAARKPATRTRARRAKVAPPAEDDGGRETSAAPTAGPTRLRRGRATSPETRRRREAMPIVPRVTDKLMVITEHGDRDQIAILEEKSLVQHYVTRAGARSMVGNVYLGRVQNVLPGMEAAFVDVGRGRNAVLYAGEVNYSPEDLEGRQPPRIEQVLKSGQSVLVQVTKDPIGGKGARLTAKISMPGRYLVLQPNWEITGISKRLDDPERRRLRALLKKIRPEGHGLIVRTAAEEASEEDLRADVDRLLAEWMAIEKKAKRAKAPAVLYEEPELTVKVVRDLFTDEEYRELATDSQRVYTLVTDYLSGVAPDLLPKVRLHTGKLPVFEEFHVVEQIHKGLDRKVWLPSGGYLVIDRTEALTVIDVNTGKSVGRTNLEETVVNTNIEAAREVARQLRLRDIGGMIIIDFIDMLLEQNKRRVVDTLKEEMARDKTRSQVFDISPLGLLEVTRKRVSGGLLEAFSETCPTCEGRGVIVNYDV
jgi:ribonuclease E